jgi:hypothetical protein
MSWLCGLLWFDVVWGVVLLLRELTTLLDVGQQIFAANSKGLMWLTPAVFASLLFTMAVPLGLIVFSVGVMRRHAGARVGLIVCCWVLIGMAGLRAIGQVYNALPQFLRVGAWVYLSRSAVFLFDTSALAVLTLLFVTRTSIKALFERENRGFEVLR